MKTKFYLLLFIACFFFNNGEAQEYWVNENFSTQAWQDEFKRLNPTYDPAVSGAFTGLNSSELYFGKYELAGAVVKESILGCSDASSHTFGDFEIGLRMNTSKTVPSIVFPTLENVGSITLHLKNNLQDATKNTRFRVEVYDSINNIWIEPTPNIRFVELWGHLSYNGKQDTVVTREVNSPTPLKMRIINNLATNPRTITFFEIEITKYSPTGVNNIETNPFRILGRKIVTEEPQTIRLYNMVGVLVYEKYVEREFYLPAFLNRGFYLARNNTSAQKIFLD